MHYQIALSIPDGYQVIEKQQRGKIHQITELLLSGKQYEYEKAINHFDGTATLFYSVLKCPYCGGETSAGKRLAGGMILKKEKVLWWSAGQTGMFEREKPELVINPVYVFCEKNYCPCCGKESRKVEDYRDLIITLEGNKIKISRKIKEFSELFRLNWVKQTMKSVPLASYETLVFHLKRGRSYLQLEDGERNPVCTRDITEIPERFESDPICQLVLESQELRRELKKVFQMVDKFPFPSREITVEKLVLVTRFLGYEKPFYSTIPFLVGTRKLESGFRNAAKKMQRAAKVPMWYERLKLPGNKSTRRILFSDPGLLFYHKEIQWICELIDNVDYLNRILTFPNRYVVFNKLYTYPILKEFFGDAFRYEKKSVLMDQIEKRFFALIDYGRLYVSMRESLRRRERNKKDWIVESIENIESEKISSVEQNPMIEDCEIEGYQFVWLINTNDFYDAGKAMHNCLRNCTYQPVVVVKKDGKFCAAIGLECWDGWKVTEARLTHNHSIEPHHPIYSVIEKWCERHQIQWVRTED